MSLPSSSMAMPMISTSSAKPRFTNSTAFHATALFRLSGESSQYLRLVKADDQL